MSAPETAARSLDETRSALLVLGMHRSGTSALTGALGLCGAWVGEAWELTEASAENPRGFWERRDMRGICDRLLLAAGADWWKVARFEPDAISHAVVQEERARFSKIVSGLDGHGTWVIKEPRLCLLLPLLRDSITNPICVHMVRDPLEVARSLKARDGFGTSAGIALWELYNRRALSASENLPRVLVSHEALVLRPAETLEGLVERLTEFGATGLETPSADRLAGLIDPSLYRRRASAEELPEFLSPSQLALWQALRSVRVFDLEDGAPVSPAARQHLFDLESVQLSLQRHSDRACELNGALATRNRTIVGLQRRTAALKAERDERQVASRALEETIAAHEASITDLQDGIAALTAERDEGHAAAKALSATVATHEATIAERQETIATHESTIETCREAIATHETTIEARQETIEALEATVTDLQDGIAALKAERDETKAAARALEATVEARDGTIRALLNSTSWRVTRPLRVVSRTCRRSLRTLRRALVAFRRASIGRTSRVAWALRRAIVPCRTRAASSKSVSPTDAPSSVSRLIRASSHRNSPAGTIRLEMHTGKKRLKVSVIAWDLAHNPLGRAYLIADVLRNDYDVEIVGSLFPRFGTDIWSPLRDCSRVVIKSVPGQNFPEHFRAMENVAEQIDGDVLFVSKPRLPSLELAILARIRRNRPIVLGHRRSRIELCPETATVEPRGIEGWRGRAGCRYPIRYSLDPIQ